MTIDVHFETSGDLGYIDKLNTMVTQTNAEMQSTREYADNQVVGMQAIKTNTESLAAQAAASAASAASVVQQDLSAIDKTFLTSTTLVDVCLYDTSRDSDGGAWRKRCSHASWENESLAGNCLGSAANEAAARAISGATTGSYYYDTTAAVFYKLNAGAGVTQVYRGNARQFPAQVLITAESARVVIWDLTQAGCPMWMVFVRPPAGQASNLYYWNSTVSSSIAMMNGVLAHGQVVDGGLSAARFIDDLFFYSRTNAGVPQRGTNIANRNAAATLTSYGSGVVVNNYINDVSMTVLPDAPVDVATGLPVPTIDVVTAGGWSRIQHDGTVISTNTAGLDAMTIGVAVAKGGVLAVGSNNGSGQNGITVTTSPSSAWNYGSTGAVKLNRATTVALLDSAVTKVVAAGTQVATAHAAGITRAVLDLSYKAADYSPAHSMVAYMTTTWASGWLPGDIRGAWLADTVTETLTGAEMVTNGTFTTDTTGWTANASTLAVVSGELQVTATSSGHAFALQNLTTVVGKTYTISCMARRGTCTGDAWIGISGIDGRPTSATSNTPVSYTFVATSTTSVLAAYTLSPSAGQTCYFDNISCRLADLDRSVKTKGLQVVGSLTKAAVASGAQLVGYSGFSASNYLEQPYNSDLDFGTGAFAFLLAGNFPASGSARCLLDRSHSAGTYSGGYVQVYIDASGKLTLNVRDGAGNAAIIATTSAVPASVWMAGLTLGYDGTNFRIMQGGIDLATPVARGAVGSLSNTSAALRIGKFMDGSTGPLNTGLLALLRATAYWPSLEQGKHIYDTEKALFEANAQCCLAGTSNAVTALTYDDETDLLHIGTSYGRSAFKGLVRVASEATPVGAIRALAAGAGIVAQAGASGADVYVPAYNLREELDREAEQAAAFGATLVAHDFDATASQTTFTLPVGWGIVAVYAQGSLKREGAAKDWTRTFDGFKWSVVFASGRSASDWISILAERAA